MFVTQLIEAIQRGGEEAHEAALILGLLIEKERVRRPAGDDGGLRLLLGDDLAERRLSSTEQQVAVNELIRYVTGTLDPHPTAVWALIKSYDPSIVPHLIKCLDRILADPDKEDVADQMLGGITIIGVGSAHKASSLEAIRRAANQGRGQVRASAKRYLELFEQRLSE